MKKRLIALDLDGTSLQDWQSMSKETIEYLKELNAIGHEIVLVTGRPFRSTEAFHDQLGLTTPIVNHNGGLLTSKHDKNFEGYSVTVDYETILDIFKNNEHLIDNAFGEILDDIYLWRDTEEIQPFLHNFNGARLFIGNFNDILPGPTNGFIIFAKKGMGYIIEDYIKTHYNGKVLCRNWGVKYNYIIEVYSPEANKGTALEYVSNYLGFDREQIIAFGDGDNDIEMIEYAGIGVSMKNGHDTLKKIANEITDYTNKENGLVKHLKKMLK